MSEKNEHNKHPNQRAEDASKSADIQPNTERTTVSRSWRKSRAKVDTPMDSPENGLKSNSMPQRSPSTDKNILSTARHIDDDVTKVHHPVYIASDEHTGIPPETERFIEQTNYFQKKQHNVEQADDEEIEKTTKKKTKRQKRREKKGRIRLIPIWLRLLIIVIALMISLILGAMIGYWLLGDGGDPRDVLKPETWYHIYDIIFDGTERQRIH
ncbi:DNA-directed RNA polymerase subunit beta [Salipaludibacillus sp. LMS25]|jgi:cation transport ATPase|uniref:DNA-directed RNA polymerase subunit beta n=1 Tax=Salipaludibacillus sp. LMS25 TaxID=2924031 RepID=UPI0020D1A407|nr:DNA-directed RNA polymerase subunit beta [Salipaludibacillus sp. LMS25]UTR16240.1 DNA-directed RNA polymerase subunit beta [Salipaludibacillus sp. LMS25]